MLAPGTRIDRYTVEERIGSGDRSEVYRGRDDLGRPVAIKLLPGHGERDRREAEAVARLSHPGIVPLIGVLEHEGQLCLVHAWAAGGSLEGRLESRGRLDLAETVRVGRDIAAALAYAHGEGILHRDLKPSNVLRATDGTYQLLDFGVVGRLDPVSGLTAAGQIAGTPLYMSPEQMTGAPQSPASDLFGLGLLLFRCLYGRLPDEAAGGMYELVRRRVSAPIDVPTSPLHDLIAGCLALDPADRPSSAAQVLEALNRVDTALATVPETTAPAPTAAPPAPYSQPDTGMPPSARQPANQVVVALAAAALVAVAFIVVLLGVDVDGRNVWLVLFGAAIAVLSIAVAAWIRRHWSRRLEETEIQASRVLAGADKRVDLTRSLMIEVDQFVGTLTSLDQKILGTTILVMLQEYESSKSSSDRQAALVHVVNLMEKVQSHRAPWYVRHRESIATSVAVVGCLTGVATAVLPLLP